MRTVAFLGPAVTDWSSSSPWHRRPYRQSLFDPHTSNDRPARGADGDWSARGCAGAASRRGRMDVAALDLRATSMFEHVFAATNEGETGINGAVRLRALAARYYDDLTRVLQHDGVGPMLGISH